MFVGRSVVNGPLPKKAIKETSEGLVFILLAAICIRAQEDRNGLPVPG
jgi:hypothetical protein